MNILILISTSFPPQEGIGHYTYNLSKKLVEKGHKVTIITRGSLKSEKFEYYGITIIKLPFLPIYPFHVRFHGFFVNRYLKNHENEFDLINIHTPLSPVPQTKLPIVNTIHGSMIENARGINIIDLRSLANKILTKLVSQNLVKNLINKSEMVTAVSEPVKKELIDYYGSNNITVTYNGVDENKFFPISENEKKNYLLYVGRLSYGKGLFDLIDAAENFKNKDIKFFLVGNGELKGKLKKIIAKKGLEEVIILKGQFKNEDLVEIYQKAMAFVFPSHYEGFPTVVLEAMSSGLPVILSDINAHKSILNDSEGLFFQKGSSEDLTSQIRLIMNNPELKKTLGSNSRKKVISKYTWENISKKYISIFNTLKE